MGNRALRELEGHVDFILGCAIYINSRGFAAPGDETHGLVQSLGVCRGLADTELKLGDAGELWGGAGVGDARREEGAGVALASCVGRGENTEDPSDMAAFEARFAHEERGRDQLSL